MPTWLTSRLCLPIWQLCADLHQVVDFRACADARRLKGAAVDGGAGADFDVVAELDRAELRHLHVPALLRAVAEPVRPQDRVGMNDNAVAEHGTVVEYDIGVEDHVVAELAASPIDDAAVQPAALADDRSRRRPGRTGEC